MNNQTPSITGANAGRSRQHNRQVVLGHIRKAGAIGRAEIARASGLSTQAVSNIIADLLGDGLLRPSGHRSAGRGAPVTQYGLNPLGGLALGVEVRPDAIIASLLDLEGSSLFTTRTDLECADPPTVAGQLTRLRDQALEHVELPARKLVGAGIVMPGPFGMRGFSEGASDLPGWENIDPAELLGAALALPVTVENDANAAAMAERVSGIARGLDSYAYLYFGAGLGLGVLAAGCLMRGAHGNAGEVGYIPVPSARGIVPLETLVSRLSVRRALAAAGILVTDMSELTALYHAQSPPLMAWLDQAAPALSLAAQTIENLFDPQTVILGGAMPAPVLDHLIDHMSMAEASVSARAGRTLPRLLRGTAGRTTAAQGAAALVINQIFTPQISAQP